MVELRRGLAKPFTSAYHQQMLHERLAVLPSGDNFPNATMQLAVGSTVLLPEYAHYRQLARIMPYYGNLLFTEGRRREAEAFLDDWQRLPVQILKGEDNLIGMLVAAACARITGEGAAIVYDRNGEPVRAREIRAQLARFMEPRERWKNDESLDIQQRDAGFFGIIFPSRCKPFIHAGELIPPHRLEYTLLEQAALSLLVLLLLVLLVIKVVTWPVWWLALRKVDTAPLLLLPSAKGTLRILLLGFVLPLAAYALYTRLPALAGRDQSFIASWPRAGTEILLLGIVLFVLPTILLIREIRQRCQHTGIPVPTPLENWKARLTAFGQGAAILVFILGLGYLISAGRDWWIYSSNLTIATLVLGGLLLLILVILSLGGGMTKVWGSFRHNGVYYGSVARTLVPLYAVLVILLSGVVYPCLAKEEAYWVQRDTLIFWRKTEGTLLTPLEGRVAAELKRQMLQAAEEAK
jgi:hypothetical protein